MKRKENKEFEHKEVENIEKNIFVIFDIISKTKWKGKKTHGY